MDNSLSRLFFIVIAFQLLFQGNPAWAVEIELQDLALPTETKDLSKASGAIYYSTTNKNKALMPVHIWGEVGRAGLHYIPVDTKLVKGISFAGGSSGQAKLDEVSVNRVEGGKIVRKGFDLSGGGDIEAHEFRLQPGDTVFVEKTHFYENRAYYTGLVSVAVALLSTIFLYQKIQEN